MRSTLKTSCALAIAGLALATGLGAQGQGKGQGQAQAKPKYHTSRGDNRQQARAERKTPKDEVLRAGRRSDEIGRGNDKDVADNPGRGNGRALGRSDERIAIQEIVGGEVEPVTFRTMIVSPRRGNQVVGRAISRASQRGSGDDLFVIQPVDNRVRVLNRSGVVLVDMDEDVELGNWRVVTTPFNDKRGAPSFCRSGAGHPVWGRQWCVDKGFGLGVDDDVRWGRIIDPRDVRIIQPTVTGDLTRDVLLGVLGDIVLNRLATQAVTLGWQDPLTGRWLGDPSVAGPRVLLVSSGPRPLAEVVDLDRDDRADMVIVAVRP